jgi:hypothetical protein
VTNVPTKIGICCLIFFISACASYRIWDETFSSRDAAVQRQMTVQSKVISEISPTDNPVHGNAILLYPSEDEIIKSHIKHEGMKHGISPSTIDYERNEGLLFLIQISLNNFEFAANAIRKRKIFDSISIEPHSGQPASYVTSYLDYIIFYDVDGWFIKGKNHPKPLPIIIDKNVPLKSQIPIFLDRLSQNAFIIKNG